jgi:hypothetical protein
MDAPIRPDSSGACGRFPVVLAMVLYLALLCAGCSVAFVVARAARACGLPVGLTVLTTLFLLLYLAWLTPGVLGLLYPAPRVTRSQGQT